MSLSDLVPALVPDTSSVNAVAIRDSSVGQYLESVNTGGTWFNNAQVALGITPTEISALDLLYAGMGTGGLLILGAMVIGTAPLTTVPLLLGSTLMGISAIGLAEDDRRAKIGATIATSTALITHPRYFVYVAQEAVKATKETVKQSVELASTSIGLTTAVLGLGTSVLATGVVLATNNNKKRKRDK